MKKFSVLVLVALLSSCASSNYLNNRTLDARDIFSFSVGYGLGAQARVSYLAEGFLFKKDVAGLKNGIGAWYGFQNPSLDIDAALGRLHVFNPPYDVYIRKHGVLIADGVGPVYYPRKDKWNPKWLTQIDATAALGLSVQVGFNPGELFDFILGWFGVDIFSDDYTEQDLKGKFEDGEADKE